MPNNNIINSDYLIFADVANIDIIKIKDMRTELAIYLVTDRDYEIVFNLGITCI